MTDTTEIRGWLERAAPALQEALDGVSAELALRRPAADRWSVLECVEHLAVTERYLFAQLLAGTLAPAPVVNLEREARIIERGITRLRRVPAPEMAVPNGRFTTLDAALEDFLAARRMTLALVERHDGDLRARLTCHPIIGEVNGYEMLLMMAVHPIRHAEQIREIRAA